MPSQYLKRRRRTVLSAIGFVVTSMLSSHAAAEKPSLSEATMSEAIGFFGVLTGRKVPADDAAWLKEQWRDAFEEAPEAIAAQVDELAFGLEIHRRDKDQLALAQSRTTALTNMYCTSAQTSDPVVRRLRNILAPDDVVLAADCLLGMLVTRFDADGLVASHALLAGAAGRTHDVEKDRREIIEAIETGFDDATPAEKAVLANGELRHAVLARYWTRIEGRKEKSAFLDEVRKLDLSDLGSPARQLENLAFKQLGDLDHLAEAGDMKLTASAVGEYIEWLEPIAGYNFDVRGLDWLKQAIIAEFQRDPQKSLGEIEGLRQMNRDRILADTVEQRREMVERWAAGLYCYASASGDPDERRLGELVFRHDPVIEADCSAERITRKSHQVVAEADGERLLEQDLGLNLRFASMILARPLLPEEETIIREDHIHQFKKDPHSWRTKQEQYRSWLAKVENHDTSVFFLGMYERKKLFDPIYCGLKASDEPYADDYLAMFRRFGAIVHEDCEQQVVTTKDEIDAFIGVVNFLAMLNGRAPFEEAETEQFREAVASTNLDNAEGYLLTLQEWWSLLTPEERIAEAQYVRDQGITPEGDGSKLKVYLNSTKAKLVGLNGVSMSCLASQTITQGQVALFAARAGGYTTGQHGGELGFPSSDLENIVFSATLGSGLCAEMSTFVKAR